MRLEKTVRVSGVFLHICTVEQDSECLLVHDAEADALLSRGTSGDTREGLWWRMLRVCVEGGRQSYEEHKAVQSCGVSARSTSSTRSSSLKHVPSRRSLLTSSLCCDR